MIGGFFFLVDAFKRLVCGDVNLADRFGISPLVIGMTIVAVGTSLPELVASVISALRGHSDVTIGNVVNFNLFNSLGVAGMVAVVTPLSGSGSNPQL
ncbi:MAG: hypothetical protein AAEC10_01030 [Rhodospirillales bacterium]